MTANTTTRPLENSFHWFALLLGFSCVAHFSVHLGRADTASLGWWMDVAALLSGLYLVHRPTIQRGLLLATVQVSQAIVAAPFNPDHWVLVFFVCAAMLVTAIWLRFQTGRVEPEEFMARFAPAGRCIFLLCYSFAALAKYNTDFLGPGSAAKDLLTHQIRTMPMLAYVVWPPLVSWIALLCETLAPLLLCFSRTRRYGIAICMLFHAALVWAPSITVFDFTAVVFTMLYLFAPAGFSQQIQRRLDKIGAPHANFWKQIHAIRWAPLVAIGGVIVCNSLWGSGMLGVSARLAWLRWSLIWICGTCAMGLTLAELFSPKSQPTRLSFWPRHLLHYAILLLALGNGFAPYVGLKTQGSFTMFSNLRTEDEHWNHLIVPRAARIFRGYQDSLVKVFETSDPSLGYKFVDVDCLVPEFEVRRYVMDNPEASISFARDGQVVDLARAADDPVFGRPLSLLPRKLLVFRPVTPDGSPMCGN